MKTTDTHSNAAIAKIVSERLVNARALCGLNLVEASERMGYTNASGLYKLENNPPSIQLWAIVKAARVYEVSTDYLLGLTDDWEADERLLERREALERLWDAWERLKSFADPGDKKRSIKIILDTVTSEPSLRARLEAEATELNSIGNSHLFRHSELRQVPVIDVDQVDYLFHRLFASSSPC